MKWAELNNVKIENKVSQKNNLDNALSTHTYTNSRVSKSAIRHILLETHVINFSDFSSEQRVDSMIQFAFGILNAKPTLSGQFYDRKKESQKKWYTKRVAMVVSVVYSYEIEKVQRIEQSIEM